MQIASNQCASLEHQITMPRPKGKGQPNNRGHRGSLKEAWAEGNYSQQEQHSEDDDEDEVDALKVRVSPGLMTRQSSAAPPAS
jgi:hypothetical protein